MQTQRLVLTRELKSRLREALLEDGADRDLTTLSVIPKKTLAQGVILAKSDGILAGLPVVEYLIQTLDRRARIIIKSKEGSTLRRGCVVARVSGLARALLSAERVSLNILSHLSGVATITRRFSERVGPGRLYDTRKTTPLWRELERYAVRVGGGVNHRFDLSKAVLIKDNHLALGGGVKTTLLSARKRLGPKALLEVEVENIEQAQQALEAGADILLVDNAKPGLLKKIIKLARGHQVLLEASGGLDLSTIGRYAAQPVDRLSVGTLTHSAPSVDFSLDLFPR